MINNDIDIRGAFESVYIFTFISYLVSLDIPPIFWNFMQSLFSHRKLVFLSLFSSKNTRTTFTGLPQGSCLNPILFNIYMSFIAKHLSMRGHRFLIYTDNLNHAIHNINIILTRSLFIVTTEKFKVDIFTRCKYTHPPNIITNNNIIPFVQNILYLGINLAPKLHWISHIQYLTSFFCR